MLAVYAIWTFVCLAIAIELKQPDGASWHLRLVRFASWGQSPKGNCSYFWSLWFAPLMGLSRVNALLILLFATIFVRLVYDWIIRPIILGERATGTLKASYWKNLVSPRERVWSRRVIYTDIPGKRFLDAIVSRSVFIAWVWVGKITALECLPNDECRVSLMGLGGLAWMLFSSAGIIYVLYSLIEKKFGQKIGVGWEFLSGKFCRQLEYRDEKTQSK